MIGEAIFEHISSIPEGTVFTNWDVYKNLVKKTTCARSTICSRWAVAYPILVGAKIIEYVNGNCYIYIKCTPSKEEEKTKEAKEEVQGHNRKSYLFRLLPPSNHVYGLSLDDLLDIFKGDYEHEKFLDTLENEENLSKVETLLENKKEEIEEYLEIIGSYKRKPFKHYLKERRK